MIFEGLSREGAELSRVVWEQVSTLPTYVAGMRKLSAFGDEVMNDPYLQEILQDRETLSREMQEALHPDIFVLAFAAQKHVEVLVPQEYRVLTIGYSTMMALRVKE